MNISFSNEAWDHTGVPWIHDSTSRRTRSMGFLFPPHWLSWSRLYEVDHDTFLPSAGRPRLSRTRKQMQSLSEQLQHQDKISCMFYSTLLPRGWESRFYHIVLSMDTGIGVPLHLASDYLHRARPPTSVWWPRMSVFFHPYLTPSFIPLSFSLLLHHCVIFRGGYFLS